MAQTVSPSFFSPLPLPSIKRLPSSRLQQATFRVISSFKAPRTSKEIDFWPFFSPSQMSLIPVGAAFGVGILVGYLLSRPSSSSGAPSNAKAQKMLDRAGKKKVRSLLVA
jgi:hypothetical protein